MSTLRKHSFSHSFVSFSPILARFTAAYVDGAKVLYIMYVEIERSEVLYIVRIYFTP